MRVVRYCEDEVAEWLVNRYNESVGVVCNRTGECCDCVVDWGRGIIQYKSMGCGTPHHTQLVSHVFDLLDYLGIPVPVFMVFLALFWIAVIILARGIEDEQDKN